jgi:hypothetical protein
MALALVGTPKVWQKFSDLLAAVQHKAHAKFVDMALNSQAQQYDERVLTSVAQPEEMASCPYSHSKQVRGSSMISGGATVRQVRAKQRSTFDVPETPEALAFNARPKIEKRGPSDHVASLQENHLTMLPVAFAPETFTMSKSDVMEMVTLPRPEDQATPVYIEKDPEMNIKLKKVIDESKSLRQRARFVMGKNSFVFPAS